MATHEKSKVETYEQFVNEKLRTDLQKVLAEQDLIYTDIAEYLQIKDTIEKLQIARGIGNESSEPLKTKVDLGCNFYAKAIVEDVSRIYISIGYGFHLEMKLDEALRFIDKKVKLMNLSAAELTDKANEIKANIKFVLEGLKEIQQLNYTKKPERRDI